MKKKILVASLALALAAILVTTGSLAWFTAENEVQNVFTVGSIDIEQIEQQRKADGDGRLTEELEPFVQDKQLLPIVPDAGKTPTVLDDTNFRDKIVTVKNTGENDAYVQTYIAVPKALDDAGVLHIENGTSSDWRTAEKLTETVKEKQIDTESTSKTEYVIYKYAYTKILAPGTATARVIEGVYIDAAADMKATKDDDGNIIKAELVMNGKAVEGFDPTGKLNVYVATQAIQAKNFADAASALAVFNTHPWIAE